MKELKLRQSRLKGFIAVGLLVVAHAAINLIWLKEDTFPLWFDYAGYLRRGVEIYYASQSNFFQFVRAIFGLGEYVHAYRPYRLVVPLFSLPWYYIFGVSQDVAVMGCITFLAIALFSTYAITSRLFDRLTGFLAAFILSISPLFFVFSRRYSPEFASTTLVALTAYLFIRSENFKNRTYSILFGIGFALSMMSKEMAFVYILAMLIYAFFASRMFLIFNPLYSKGKRPFLNNLILSLFIAGIIILPIYLIHIKHVIDAIFHAAFSKKVQESYGTVNPYTLQGLMFYLRHSIMAFFRPFYTLLTIVGVFFCLKDKVIGRGFIFFWFIGSYLFLCSTQTRSGEYSMPLLIPLAILASYGVTRIFKNRILKIALIALVIIYGGAQFWNTSFPIANLPGWVYYRNLLATKYFEFDYPRTENWKLAEIVDCIIANKNDINKIDRVHVGANTKPFSPMTLHYVGTQKRGKLIFWGYSLSTEQALSCDFVVIKSGENQGVFYSPERMQELLSRVGSRNDYKRLPCEFHLPDGSTVEIYKKRGQATFY